MKIFSSQPKRFNYFKTGFNFSLEFILRSVSGQCGVERMMLFISDNVPRTVSLSSPILSSFKGNVNNNKFTDASFYKFQLMHFKREITKHIEFVDIWSDMYSFYC